VGIRADPSRLEAILEVTRSLAQPFELAPLLERIVEAARSVLEADRGTVFLYDAATDELVSLVGTGLEATRIPAGRGIAGACVRERSIVNVADAYADPRFNPDVDRATGYRTRDVLAVPLVGHEGALVGVLQLLNRRDGPFDSGDEAVARALAAQCAVAVQRVRLTEQLVATARMRRELALARRIQIGILPRDVRAPAGYDVGGVSYPAEETGGDTFDVMPTPDNGLILLLGDATGHGLGPALSVTQVRSMLRVAVRLGADFDRTFVRINDQLAADLAADRFVTAFVGLLDPRRHVVRFHSAGQGPLLVHRQADGESERLEPTTFPLGLMAQPVEPPHGEIELRPGDILALVTDGILEQENEAGEPFGVERVEALIADHRGASMVALAERLVAASREFAGAAKQDDDVTILLLRRSPGGGSH